MRAVLLTTLVTALCLTTALPALAQDGAPVPLTAAAEDTSADTSYEPEGYVPLPETAEGEVPPLADGTQLESEDEAPVEDFAAVEETVPAAPVDPMVECTEQAGVDHKGKPVMSKITNCLEEKHFHSESVMATAAVAANARMKVQGKGAARTLASSNLAFTAFRDAECLRRKNAAADQETAQQVEWACRAAMNDTRGQMLQTQ